MTDKPAQPGPVSTEDQDVTDMLRLEGRHEGHSLTRVGEWWLCSCSKEVKRSA